MNKDIIKGVVLAIIVSVTIIYFIEKKKGVVGNVEINKLGKKLVIGDSHAVGIGSKTSGVEVDKRIAVGGWMLSNLLNALYSYPISPDVSAIFISIGTNGQFSQNDKIEELINVLHQKFPNAVIYAFKGSYGWSGSLSKSSLEAREKAYYNRFQQYGVRIMKNGLGYFTDGGMAHTTSTPQSLAIINEIQQIIN
jgi:hypothetical protein